MGRPQKDKKKKKIKTGVTLDPDLFEWVQSKIKTKDFSNLTHAVEKGLFLLKEKMEGKK
ncbi:Uncharacterised protein [uncultured archaeon]|nr:Uncharacterised protein [uncultured archaeon]